jgi:hypothetical protein
MKREDKTLRSISAGGSSQVNYTTQSSEIKAGCLPAARIVGVWMADGVRAHSSLLLFMIKSMCVGRILPVVRAVSICVREAVY